jgi:hypothetical protein
VSESISGEAMRPATIIVVAHEAIERLEAAGQGPAEGPSLYPAYMWYASAGLACVKCRLYSVLRFVPEHVLPLVP